MIDVVVDHDEVRFCIVEKKSREELLVLYRVYISEIRKIMGAPIKEAIEANAIAVVIYDKLVGDNIE